MDWIAQPLGYRCNNGCRFCGQGGLRNAASTEISEERVREALSRARAAGASKVWFVGGEPTARDDLPLMIGLARELGFERVGVQTNGRRLAYPGYRRDLLAAEPSDLEVSLHGTTSACHDHLTRVPGAFEQTLQGIRGLKRSALRLGLAQVLDRSNFRQLGEMVRLAHRLGATRLRWAFPESLGGVRDDPRRLGPRVALLGPRLRAAAALGRSLEMKLTLAGVPDCHRPAGLLRGPTHRSSALRRYAECCEPCPSRAHCPGLPVGYAAHLGTGELNALTSPCQDEVDREAPGLVGPELP